MTTKDHDGCGPNSWDTGSGDPFLDECRIHDANYDTRKLSELLADKDFVKGMLARIEREKLWYRKPVLLARAALYAGVVTGLGWIWYNT